MKTAYRCAAGLSIILVLVACGGGTSGPGPAAAITAISPVTGASSVAATTSTLAFGLSVSNGTVATATLALTCDGQTVTGATGIPQTAVGTGASATVTYGVYLPPAASCSLSGSALLSGPNGASMVPLENSFRTDVAHYDANFVIINIAERFSGVGILTKSGVQGVFNNGNVPNESYLSCSFWNKLLSNGWPFVQCRVFAPPADIARDIAIDPNRGSYESANASVLPTGAALLPCDGPNPYASFGVGDSCSFIDTVEGTYYILKSDVNRNFIRLTSDNFASSAVVATGLFGYMARFRN